ncbi:hypothetical protein K432DRAFT_312045 [Lepidopterella palustris CBS 459.81]|uniref:Uncharacterized protein n=1 Tax=Lepidopterella palustris CBS 459.81 TaxID=1314670 RepID=A0A8E2DY93_9PEZI|nr:hypothetical protein K432DRAFT_312045 [Lepidopterella palustris CBS 459.81]
MTEIHSDLSGVPAEGLSIFRSTLNVEPNFIKSIDREFVCAHGGASMCNSGQYTLNLSRKTISDHFGRNKACTRAIEWWPLLCRKHYQRFSYRQKQWSYRKLDYIDTQLNYIEGLHPNIKYIIQLKKSEEKRLAEFAKATAFLSDATTGEAATAALPAPDAKAKSFEAPIQVLQQLNTVLGIQKTTDDCKAACALIRQMLERKETEDVPNVEFLPQIPLKNAISTKKRKDSCRISKNGAIQKP